MRNQNKPRGNRPSVGNARNRRIERETPAHLQEDDALQIFPGARVFKTTLTKKFRERKNWKRPDVQEVKSIIPGVVTSLEVKEGDHVEEGEHIITFEAMKMQNIVLAPFAGTVNKIHVTPGQKIAKGVPMLYLLADETPQEYHEDDINVGDLGLIV
jgi:biotin carboxyl carrier protein